MRIKGLQIGGYKALTKKTLCEKAAKSSIIGLRNRVAIQKYG